MCYLIYFINTNLQSRIRISHLESVCLVLITKQLILLEENEHPANKLKSTNRHRDMNYMKHWI